MAVWGMPSRKLRAALAAALLAALTLPLAACANSYAGIPLAPGAADPELQELARRAQAGDKQAQLELGIRYEEGRGVPADLPRAERLYRAAARDQVEHIRIYSPPVRPGQRGFVHLFRTGEVERGLPQAATRLARLIAERER